MMSEHLVHVGIKALPDQKAKWEAHAQEEQRSLSQWLRIQVEFALQVKQDPTFKPPTHGVPGKKSRRRR